MSNYKIEEELFDLVSRFLEAKRKEILEIESALARDDFESVKFFAHKIKGVGKMYGFAPITDIGQLLNRAAEAKEKSESCAQLQALKEFLFTVHIERKAP